ncbi:MAG: HD domain-containing protein [Bacilli bacterium]|jgi:3'-5' exoribonuclease|nr:HD domain-containing protein [Bacilli bacterium]MDY0209030.1 HD domain-containing protein [Bacilli bacterium]
MNRIKDFNATDKATLVLRFTDVQIRKTSSNADYASLLGFDGKDLIDVKIWSLSEDKKQLLKSGEIYVATGIMKDYQGKLQFNVNDFRLATEEDEISKEEFYEYAKLSIEVLQNEIKKYIEALQNKAIKDIVIDLIKQYYKEFFLYPAAMTMHHNYYSGLAYHIYSMLQLSDRYLEIYPFLNKDLVHASIILHDLGKIVELSGPKGTEYTKEGNLLGHITIGANLVYASAVKLGYEKTDEALALQHIIISHHGLLEYGSPKEPQMAEAVLVYLLDFSDSRMAALEKEIPNGEKGQFTNPIAAFDRKSFYIPDIK